MAPSLAIEPMLCGGARLMTMSYLRSFTCASHLASGCAEEDNPSRHVTKLSGPSRAAAGAAKARAMRPRAMRRIIFMRWLVLSGLTLWLGAADSRAQGYPTPGFDCANASMPQELRICRSH